METIIPYSQEYKQPCKAQFGQLERLVTSELLTLCKGAKYVVIYGHTKSGKVVIGRAIASALGRRLIISDHYQNLGWSENMYKIRSIIKASHNEPMIIEGVQMCRLLRKGVQFNDFFADLVIHLTINKQSLMAAYRRDGEGHKAMRAITFNKNILDKIFFEWYQLQQQQAPKKMPKIIHIDTSFL